ncbi:hypothetical protein [Streptomyces sp. NPDC001250]|uniref:hypothetical protein n=1 Tax=Streptomyces sp. NPDC001250 TaxID=3154382 RepID=UPI003328E555
MPAPWAEALWLTHDAADRWAIAIVFAAAASGAVDKALSPWAGHALSPDRPSPGPGDGRSGRRPVGRLRDHTPGRGPARPSAGAVQRASHTNPGPGDDRLGVGSCHGRAGRRGVRPAGAEGRTQRAGIVRNDPDDPDDLDDLGDLGGITDDSTARRRVDPGRLHPGLRAPDTVLEE